jgi:hypothetical protein
LADVAATRPTYRRRGSLLRAHAFVLLVGDYWDASPITGGGYLNTA